MSATSPCVPSCCTETQTVNVPGSTGASSLTTLGATLTIPSSAGAPPYSSSITVGDTSWMEKGMVLVIGNGSGASTWIVTAINSATGITANYLAVPGNLAAATVLPIGAIVASGMGNWTVPTDLDALTAFTDNSGGTKSDTIAASLIKSTVIIPIQFTDYVNATTLKIAVPFAFTVNSVLLRVSKAGTGAGASITLQTQINGVAVTGGSVVSTLANSATVGGTVAGTAITGSNTGTAGQTLELAVTVGTVFTAGDGWFEFSVSNMDLAATIAAIAFKANQLRTALRHQ